MDIITNIFSLPSIIGVRNGPLVVVLFCQWLLRLFIKMIEHWESITSNQLPVCAMVCVCECAPVRVHVCECSCMCIHMCYVLCFRHVSVCMHMCLWVCASVCVRPCVCDLLFFNKIANWTCLHNQWNEAQNSCQCLYHTEFEWYTHEQVGGGGH